MYVVLYRSVDKNHFNQTLLTLDSLQRKVQWLEEENLHFTSEVGSRQYLLQYGFDCNDEFYCQKVHTVYFVCMTVILCYLDINVYY